MEKSDGNTGSFHGASHFTINQPKMIENQYINIADEDAYKVLAILQNEISAGAMHNSRERYDAPKCHPGTREKILKEITSWIDDPNPESHAMWLRGPAGAGKSAIAQTVAEQCIEDGKLGGAFFFSRHDDTRNSSQPFVATIAYQLAVYIPEMKKYLADVLRDNGPALLKMAFEWQMQKLVVEPLQKLYSEYPNTNQKCIMIDGLDECQESMQAEIISSIAKAASISHRVPVFFLLISRPEIEIRQAIKKERIGTFVTLNLDDKYDPEKDIDWFLRDKFNQIRMVHPSGHNLDSNWPSNEKIEHILQHSSGQFIYAATIIRFVENPRQNPIKSLDKITSINGDGNEKTFTELDNLYIYILNTAIKQDGVYPQLLSIFEALLYLRNLKIPEILDSFLMVEDSVVLLLTDLYSLLRVPENLSRNEITFYHASFGDFLRDEKRSGKFFIQEAKAHLHLSECCVRFLKTYSLDKYSEFPKVFYPSIREYFYHIHRCLQLNPAIFRNESTANDGIASACRAVVESGYATIGFHFKFHGVRIYGILWKTESVYKRELMAHKLRSTKDWIFEEMEEQSQQSEPVFSIGTYIQRGAGLWNHITINDSASLEFIQRQDFTPLFKFPLGRKLKTDPHHNPWRQFHRSQSSNRSPYHDFEDQQDTFHFITVRLMKWLASVKELPTPVENIYNSFRFLFERNYTKLDTRGDRLLVCLEAWLRLGLDLRVFLDLLTPSPSCGYSWMEIDPTNYQKTPSTHDEPD